jgi:hypothetical protein
MRLPLPSLPAEMPANPPRNGATQVKLITVNASAPKIVPTTPPFACFACNRFWITFGSVSSYIPNRLRARTRNSTARSTLVTGCALSHAMNFSSANADTPRTVMMVRL